MVVGACGLAALSTAAAGAAEPSSTLKWKSRGAVSAPTSRHTLPAGEGVRLVSYYDSDLKPAQAVDDPSSDPFGDKSSGGARFISQPPPTAPQTLPPMPPFTQPPPLVQPSSPNDPGLPTIPPNEGFAQGGGFVQEKCPELSEFKKIDAITNRIAASPGDLPKECIIDDRVETPMNRPWAQTVYTWKASGMCHKPLYFEEAALERYGHSTGPFTQPFVSGAHFFGTLPLLPYKMGMDPPGECKYALGYYRPGSCAPYIIGGVPISARGIAAQTAAVLGWVYLMP